jgi:hypothetical protein
LKFLIGLFNHNELGRRSLEDPSLIIEYQLRALGHEVIRSNNRWLSHREGYNVMFEGFTRVNVPMVARAHADGARFIVIATEEPTPTGFNHGITPGMADRQKQFPDGAKYVDAVLALVPGASEWYGQFAPSMDIELGYSDAMLRGPDKIAPDHEFGFYGSRSKRRSLIFRKLANLVGRGKNGVVVVDGFIDQLNRDAQMRRAKVIVQVRHSEAMGLVSSSRCCTSLFLRRPVLAEPHQLSKPWNEIIYFAETLDEFYRTAATCRLFWQDMWMRQFERFRSIMTPERCIGNQLRVLGITTGPISKSQFVPTKTAQTVSPTKRRNRLLSTGAWNV